MPLYPPLYLSIQGDRGSSRSAPHALLGRDDSLARAAQRLAARPLLPRGVRLRIRRGVGHGAGWAPRGAARRRSLPGRGHEADDARCGEHAQAAWLRDAGPAHAAQLMTEAQTKVHGARPASRYVSSVSLRSSRFEWQWI
eukprot:scaffold86236_cov69-Phaeocystis_antarctica.AAC.3